MFNIKNKKRGFTLIELIIVIAIIAILAAIAVPAFGQIREKANGSSDLGNARTIYSLVATEIASDKIILPTVAEYYPLNAVGEQTGIKIDEQIDPKPKVKQVQNAYFIVKLYPDGKIEVGYSKTKGTASGTTSLDGYQVIYPTSN